MELIQQTPDTSAYLAADEAVDHRHPLVAGTASRLRALTGGRTGDTEDAAALVRYAEAAFDFVRDTVPHSFDSGDPRVAWRASDVLATRNGICHAKSHAPAALLRHEGIPTALCYQKLDVVHGLVAVRLPGRPWARQDPRGNKPGVDARFSLDGERLAFTPDRAAGEYDIPLLYAAPPEPVLTALRSARDRAHLELLLPRSLGEPEPTAPAGAE
ncbi:transglutaminase family protein [Streptomyces desertarenae]|uniref:Transglutaminase family protein n=1 Tax=Streptomyces desertarenae TaxID=2666184 RepID=A0ABW4PG75_9ACTN